MKIKNLLPALALGLVLVGCKKSSDSTLNPGQSSFAFQLKAVNPSATVSRVQGGLLTWTSGSATANLVKFEAKRGSTEVEYKTPVSQTINLFADNPSLGNITLDAGTYTEIEFKAFLVASGTNPSLELHGQYVSNGNTVNVVFRSNESILLKAEKHNVTLDGATSYQAVTPVNLGLATQTIAGSSFDNAVRTGGEILITPNSECCALQPACCQPAQRA
jgi:hypothetical protein